MYDKKLKSSEGYIAKQHYEEIAVKAVLASVAATYAAVRVGVHFDTVVNEIHVETKKRVVADLAGMLLKIKDAKISAKKEQEDFDNLIDELAEIESLGISERVDLKGAW